MWQPWSQFWCSFARVIISPRLKLITKKITSNSPIFKLRLVYMRTKRISLEIVGSANVEEKSSSSGTWVTRWVKVSTTCLYYALLVCSWFKIFSDSAWQEMFFFLMEKLYATNCDWLWLHINASGRCDIELSFIFRTGVLGVWSCWYTRNIALKDAYKDFKRPTKSNIGKVTDSTSRNLCTGNWISSGVLWYWFSWSCDLKYVRDKYQH